MLVEEMRYLLPGTGQPGVSRGELLSAPVEIDLSATGFTIVPGHRLRLQVSSGAYPRYEAPVTPGTTTLELGPDSPAQLTLPVVTFAAAD